MGLVKKITRLRLKVERLQRKLAKKIKAKNGRRKL